jgi:glycerate kinase
MRILIAPNAFKNSLSAADAALAIRNGLLGSRLGCTCECFPTGDGGDGTWELLTAHFHGTTIKHCAHDPLGRAITASYGWLEESKTAFIGLSEASGIRLLKKEELDPIKATTYGTGELIRHALDQGAETILLSAGGSASVDGGKGILNALGARFIHKENGDLQIDLSGLHSRVGPCKLIVLCDVENLLLGNQGAARVFGPQKGASEEQVIQLEHALAGLAEAGKRFSGIDAVKLKHGGAAGGVAAGLAVFLDAKLVNGAAHFLDTTHFDTALSACDLVITAEGSLDGQTLHGKGPFEVARRAKSKDIPVIGLAGTIKSRDKAALSQYFSQLISINREITDLKTALKKTKENLMRTAKELGDQLAIG